MKLNVPRFRLRTMFLMVTLFSVALAFVVIPAKRQAEAVRKIYSFRFYDAESSLLASGPGQVPPILGYRHQREGRPGEPQEAQLRRWMRNRIGNEYFGDIVTVQLDNTEFGDDDMRILASFPNLDFLRLKSTKISDEGLKSLQEFQGVEFLALNSTKISDAGLIHLGAMPNLRRLSITNTRVTDKSVPLLRSLTNLRELWLKGTDISDEGFRQLNNSLPDCKIQPPAGWSHQRTSNRSSTGQSVSTN